MPNVVPCSPVEVRAGLCRLPISLVDDEERRRSEDHPTSICGSVTWGEKRREYDEAAGREEPKHNQRDNMSRVR